MRTTTEWYRLQLFKFGIITLINVLEYFEFDENYEECHKIIEAVREQERVLGIKIPTEITKEVINDVIDQYKKFNMTGKFALKSSKYYATLVLKEIENK